MPFAQIYMLDGRTDEQKKAVIEMVVAALDEAVGTPVENIRVWIHDTFCQVLQLLSSFVYQPNCFPLPDSIFSEYRRKASRVT
jgi:4-oxalocrotonate tautomerase